MILTFTAVFGLLLVLIRPLQRNPFFILHFALVVGGAYLTETYCFKLPPFQYKAFLLLIVYHLISINVVTFLAYGIDKRAAKRGDWRVSEARLHSLELLGGWASAYLAQKFFHHKTKKKSYQAMFWLMLVFQICIIYFILNYLGFLH